MAEKIKYTQKELKRPDKIRKILSSGLENASRHFNKIAIGIGILLLLFIIAYFLTSGSSKKELLANQMFDRALKTYNTGGALEALNMFKELNSQYPNNKISKLALYYAGIINYEIERYEESIVDLSAFFKNKINDKIIIDSAYLTLGLSSYNLQKWDDSIEYLSKIDDETSPYFEQAKLHQGLSYEKKGDFEKSKEIFDKVLVNRNQRLGISAPN
ncbi:MAG: tetratricopeptide repeat protein [Thermodesulfobacteriota bacterium]